MFEFTKRSKKILEVLAQSEAKRLNSDALGPEHIMISLLKDDDSVAARILKNLGINFGRLINEIEQVVRQSGSSIILGKVPAGSRYKIVIELSKEEAQKLKNSYIGTEHLLLAIFREASCAGLEALIKAGYDYSVVRNEILRVLGVKVGAEKAQKAKAASKPSALEEYAHDLTRAAQADQLDPVIGREDEINRVIRILSRKRKNNPILIGEAGVGKTAIVEGLAQKIIKKQVPEILQDSQVMSLDMASIVAGTKYRGEFEERLKRLVNEIKETSNIIIFIDEVHTIIGAGAAEGAIDAANILKPALARGELQCIGATTINEYKLHIEKDTALARRFQTVFVDEPDVTETIEILKGLKERYESHHKVKFDAESLVQAAVFADRYITDRYLPDKAIDLIDEAGAMARLDNFDRPEDIDMLEKELDELNTRKNELVMAQEYEQAAAVRDRINEKKMVLETKLMNWHERKDEYAVRVSSQQIAALISENTGIPLESIEKTEAEKLLHIEEELHRRVIGQDDAISSISKSIRRSRTGLSSIDRPKGVFVFLGPTGVGKTELAKALAEFLFNDEKNLVRLDMSEYMEKHSVARLIGAPPGYIGYEEGGQLTEKIRRKPYSVILFDEIEKAHPDVFNILLQVFEEGELTDGSGTTISFRETIIILTSNVGNREYQKSGRLGFYENPSEAVNNNEKVQEELVRLFSPEFLNRIDEVIFFHKLDKKQISKIVEIMIDAINGRLSERGIELEFTKSVKKYIIDKGFSDKYGARNLRRVIQTDIEDPLASELLRDKFSQSNKLQVVKKANRIAFRELEKKVESIDDGPDHDETGNSKDTKPVGAKS